MSWQNNLTIMVRILIGDANPTNYKYADDRIAQALVVAAAYVVQDYNFPNHTYTLDFENVTIEPDPTDPDSYDSEFIALVPLKAACLFMQETYNKQIVSGLIRVKEGDSEVATGGISPVLRDILSDGVCARYNKILDILLRRKIRGRAISSPYTSLSTSDQWGSVGHIRSFYDGFLGW